MLKLEAWMDQTEAAQLLADVEYSVKRRNAH